MVFATAVPRQMKLIVARLDHHGTRGSNWLRYVCTCLLPHQPQTTQVKWVWTLPLARLLPFAVERLHVGDLHAIVWGPRALVIPVKAIREQEKLWMLLSWSAFLKKMGQTQPLFRLFSVFFKQTSIQFYNKLMWKNVHPVYGTGIRTHDLQNVSLLP